MHTLSVVSKAYNTVFHHVVTHYPNIIWDCRKHDYDAMHRVFVQTILYRPIEQMEKTANKI